MGSFIAKLAHLLGWKDTIDELEYVPITYVPRASVIPNPPPMNPDELNADWSDPKNAYHNTRVLCDLAGLSVAEKNLICACIYQESTFKNTAKCENKDPHTGAVWSVDYGICQINDHFHIGPGKDFPSVQYVLSNPGEAVKWMIKMYHWGRLNQWVSYSSGAYKQWLKPNSPMWALKPNA